MPDETLNLKGLMDKLGLKKKEQLDDAFSFPEHNNIVERLDSDSRVDRIRAHEALMRKIRYWCFRFKTEAETGGENPADGAPEGLKEVIEAAEGFEGWEFFAESWDIAKDDMVGTEERLYTIHEEWEAKLRRVVPVLKMVPKTKPGQIRVPAERKGTEK